MARDSDSCRSNCPINFALETFGDKWTLLVIRDLMFKGKSHYGEFLDSGEGISTNILADRLQRLERNGVIERTPDPDSRSRVIYRLTEMGRDLLPVMLEITAWSGKYDSKTNAPASLLKKLKKDKERVIATFQSELVPDPQ
jgi:DNA-binding HxlR family transcriptional regulator